MARLRIDPRTPVLWRSSTALQVGLGPDAVAFDPVTRTDLRLLAALRAGVPASALAAAGRCGAARAEAFLARIAPQLERPVPRRAPVELRSLSRVPMTTALAALEPVTADSGPRIGLLVVDHVAPLRVYADWLRDGVAHVAVMFRAWDAVVTAPVLPGVSGCLRCADLRHADRDPAWPALAGQLLAEPAAAAGQPLLRVAALQAALGIADAAWRTPSRAHTLRGVHLTQDGLRRTVGNRPHPECGCGFDLEVGAA